MCKLDLKVHIFQFPQKKIQGNLFAFVGQETCSCNYKLEKYLKRIKVWRGKDKTQLLLSFVKPYNPVISSTISGWIKNVLREAGIDTKIFKGHSTRSASTSKAGMAGLSV